MGYTIFNWALRYVEASAISGTIVAEPVVSALLAWLTLSERPGIATIVGGVVVLSGLSLSGLFLLLPGRWLPTEPVA
jgi:drug/metabolite transporter (DMT)-like permease